jgi:hypothetical protein
MSTKQVGTFGGGEKRACEEVVTCGKYGVSFSCSTKSCRQRGRPIAASTPNEYVYIETLERCRERHSASYSCLGESQTLLSSFNVP